MTRLHIFADESGNFDFSNQLGATKYFAITSVTFFDDFATCGELEQLRYDLAWDGIKHPGPFHATTDKQAIRDRVFDVLAPHDFRIDATLLDKRKTQPHLRVSDERFYKYAWYYHLKYVAPQICGTGDEILIIAATIGTRKKQDAFHAGVKDVISQTVPAVKVQSAHWPASCDPGLQIADYCSWAIQRKWESSDQRSYSIIQSKIRSEFDLFARGPTTFY